MQTTCTSFSIASLAASSGVWNSGPMSTSKPRSANAVATTLAPRSCPSCPSLAILTRGRPAASSAHAHNPHRAAPGVLFGEGRDLTLQLLPALGRIVGSSVHTGHLLDIGAVAA